MQTAKATAWLARQKHRADTQVAALRGQLQKKGQQAARLKLQVAGLSAQLQASQQQAEARAAAFEAQLQGQQQLLGAFQTQLQEVASRQRAEGDLPQLWAAKLEAHEARMLEVRSMPSSCRQLWYVGQQEVELLEPVFHLALTRTPGWG